MSNAATATSLGLVEVPFFSIAAVVADDLAKAAEVVILGFEPLGTETILIRIGGAGPGDVRAALQAAEARAKQLGASATTTLLAAPDPRLANLNSGPVAVNALYGGREEMRPDPNTTTHPTMSTNKPAIGILETQGLAAILEATDAMLKAANVRLVGKEKIGSAYVTVIVEGDVAAVRAAVDAGAQAVGALGKLIAAHVIARPHDELRVLLPK